MGGNRLVPVGTRLGHYRVEAFLARGSTGEVYRARDEQLDREVALKVVPPWLGEDERIRERFLAEARAAASLDHPNVLPVYDAGDADGTLWIAMRLAEGPDLRELLRRGGPLPPERALALLAGIGAALDAAHARGILHRDVKPANILLGAESASGVEHAYLADFGLATVAHGRGLTRTGELLGTIDYVSPEQARGQALDARSDVYSLAAVLFECLTGVAPFHRDTELASLTARLEAPPPPPSTIRADLPEALDPVLVRGLAREPGDRYPSAGALITAATASIRGARLRGLLFADLRGYTAFAEREGDARAAALLSRYRALVRAAVTRPGGAEVRTEGDSFYVVFPSATAAIRAGLAIVGAAAAATDRDGALPIRPGVGVHVGEPLEGPEGPVGAAVNTAARLCSLAGPGEVLVSATARDLARGSRDLAFASRGAHSAKGLAEPLEVWAASQTGPRPAGGASSVALSRVPVSRRRGGLFVAGAAGALLVAVAAIAVLAGRPAGSAGASPAATSVAGAQGPSAPSIPAGASVAPSPSATAAVPAASPTLGPFPSETEAAILAALPVALARTCRRGGTTDDARLAGFIGSVRGNLTGTDGPVEFAVTPSQSHGGVTCYPAGGAARLYVMAPGGYIFYPGDEYLGFLEGRYKLPQGSCATDNRAYERWVGPRGTGILACMNQYEGRPWIYFSFSGGRYLAFATRDDADYSALYGWWDQLKTFLP